MALALHAMRQRACPFIDLPAPQLSLRPDSRGADRSLARPSAFVAELRDRFGDRFVDSIWPEEETAEERRWLREAQEAAGDDTDLLYETDGSEEDDGLGWLVDGGELGTFIG